MRALRRHHALRVKIRRYNLLYSYFHNKERLEKNKIRALNRMGRWMMRQPGKWEHEMMIVPSRREQNQLLKLRVDLDKMLFPNYKKPVIYYW